MRLRSGGLRAVADESPRAGVEEERLAMCSGVLRATVRLAVAPSIAAHVHLIGMMLMSAADTGRAPAACSAQEIRS